MSKGPKVPGPSPEEIALKEVSIAQHNDWVKRFVPAESELIRRSELTAGEKASVRGQAATDVASAFKGLTKGTITAGEAGGADVSSGKTKMSLAGNADARGQAIGMGTVAGELGAMAAQDKQQAGIAAMGRDIAADATASFAQGARRASKVALATAAAKWETNVAAVNAGMAVAGAATRKYVLNDKWTSEEQAMNRKRLNESGLVGAPDFGYKAPFDYDPDNFYDVLTGK